MCDLFKDVFAVYLTFSFSLVFACLLCPGWPCDFGVWLSTDHHFHFHTPLFVCLCICELTGEGREAWRGDTGGAGGGDHHCGWGWEGKKEGKWIFAVTWCLFSWCIYCRRQQRIVCLVIREKLEYKYQNIRWWTFMRNLVMEKTFTEKEKKTHCSNI